MKEENKENRYITGDLVAHQGGIWEVVDQTGDMLIISKHYERKHINKRHVKPIESRR